MTPFDFQTLFENLYFPGSHPFPFPTTFPRSNFSSRIRKNNWSKEQRKNKYTQNKTWQNKTWKITRLNNTELCRDGRGTLDQHIHTVCKQYIYQIFFVLLCEGDCVFSTLFIYLFYLFLWGPWVSIFYLFFCLCTLSKIFSFSECHPSSEDGRKSCSSKWTFVKSFLFDFLTISFIRPSLWLPLESISDCCFFIRISLHSLALYYT